MDYELMRRYLAVFLAIATTLFSLPPAFSADIPIEVTPLGVVFSAMFLIVFNMGINFFALIIVTAISLLYPSSYANHYILLLLLTFLYGIITIHKKEKPINKYLLPVYVGFLGGIIAGFFDEKRRKSYIIAGIISAVLYSVTFYSLLPIFWSFY